MTAVARILVVEDARPWREFISSILGRRSDVQIVGEATDGREAVQKAEQLRPDLILLDIALPHLNGLEVARRVLASFPVKIIFLTQQASADVMQEAFSLGAGGYVVKVDAARELLPALDAVLNGARFVSRRLSGRNPPGATLGSETVAGLSAGQASALLSNAEGGFLHEVQFYSEPGLYWDSCSEFLGATLKAGGTAVFVATELNRNSILGRLQAYGVDVDAAVAEDRYITLDVVEALSQWMVNEWPDPDRFFTMADALIRRSTKSAKQHCPRVVLAGECAPFLCSQGKTEAAIWLEHLWDGIARSQGVDILCCYHRSIFQAQSGDRLMRRISAEHSVVRSV